MKAKKQKKKKQNIENEMKQTHFYRSIEFWIRNSRIIMSELLYPYNTGHMLQHTHACDITLRELRELSKQLEKEEEEE